MLHRPYCEERTLLEEQEDSLFTTALNGGGIMAIRMRTLPKPNSCPPVRLETRVENAAERSEATSG